MNSRCVVVGDFNLYWLKRANPVSSHVSMVEAVQDTIETEGFSQIISSYTRSWENRADSCIDHCWTNHRERIVRWANEVRGDLDHNVITVEMSGKYLKKRWTDD